MRPSCVWRGPLASGLAAAWLVLAALPAHAGLFDDDEARKAILEIRSRMQANDDSVRSRMTELQQANAQLLEQVQQLRRTLLDLNTQLETQRTETARLRGGQEQLTRDLSDTQQRLQDTLATLATLATLDTRLRTMEPQKVTLDGQEFMVEPAERRQYEAAMVHLRTADFDKAAVALGAFVQRYPNSGYIDSARFWLGSAQYGQKNFRDAITSFRAMVAAAPNHPRAPEAMLALANCQAETKDVRGARRTLEDLIKAYPGSEAAAASKERLGTLKG